MPSTMSNRRDLMSTLRRLLPFLEWFPVSSVLLRSDLIAGITGALVLVPKAMAYAQLSGLPVHFGLYVAFVPAILGALWGSSRQLATGPVAIISLMTAAAITPLAAPFSGDFISLALLLTLMVGIIQFAMAAMKLGTIVNFVSHPVILGFMNAAAVIIGLSQLDMLLGIPKGRSDSFLMDMWEMLGYLPQIHLPTLAMAAFALVLMLALKRIALVSKLNVLIAVVVTIVVSQLSNFEHKSTAAIDHILDPNTRELLSTYTEADERVKELAASATAGAARLRSLEASNPRAAAQLRHQIHVMQIDASDLLAQNKARLRTINRLRFERPQDSEPAGVSLHLAGKLPAGLQSDGRPWRIKRIDKGELILIGGGDVVGRVPQGLPAFRIPTITLEGILSLLSAAIVIALVAFMESIAMAKAMAAKTKQRIDPNQELMGQGIANLGGAFFQSYPACGSFTGSAINLQSGAKTGFAMVFNGLFVVCTLLFLTPYLYHLPKATLGIIILFAVTSLITPAALKHTWRASRSDGLVALTTFVVTLIAAPHLDKGILVGASLAILIFLYRTMKPRVAQLGRHSDGTLRDLLVYPNMPTSENVVALRFDDALYFANAPFFEDAVLAAVADNSRVKYLLVVGSGINQIDASGEEVVRHLVERLSATGITIVFSGLKKQILDVMRRTGLFDLIGADNFFPNEERALIAIYRLLGPNGKGELLNDTDPVRSPTPSGVTLTTQ